MSDEIHMSMGLPGIHSSASSSASFYSMSVWTEAVVCGEGRVLDICSKEKCTCSETIFISL